ncbi:MAG: HD domain-containing protein [Armatimonadota bacterium]|nr:HD domain-containing protein [Armatimonadota bacterium]
MDDKARISEIKEAPPAAPAQVKLLTLEEIRRDPEVEAFIAKADAYTAAIGYTEHGFRHASLVASIAMNILKRLGYEERQTQLAAIAGYLHDIGNVVGRINHEHTGALLAGRILERLGMDPAERAIVMGAIGNHEEDTGDPVSPVGAAVILADKSDVHRTRVRNPDPTTFDIHDRVNYAVEHSFLRVDEIARAITLELVINTEISKVMEYFEIFLSRMVMCRRAAQFLGCDFKLQINGVKLL